MRNILITGGAGFIGSNFVHYWLKHHAKDNLIVLDALTYAGNVDHLQAAKIDPAFHFIKGNILDRTLMENIFKQYSIDTVVHFAAESHVDRSITGPGDFIQSNVVGTYTLLDVAKQYWSDKNISCRFHHVSTDEVYGSLGPANAPFTETSPYQPNSPYAASKAASDHLVRAYGKTYQLPVTISNCSNNYGPYQHPEKFIPTVIRSCLEGKPIPIYGDGSNVRDWLHVEDHCAALDLILQKGKVGETYNIGGNNEISNLHLAKEICHLLDVMYPQEKSYTSLIQYVTDRLGHDWRYAIDPSKTQQQLGFAPRIDFKKGLQNTIAFYMKHLD